MSGDGSIDATSPPDAPAGAAAEDPAAQRYIVWGDSGLALRLVRELLDTYQARVTVILPSATANQGPEIAGLTPLDGDRRRCPKVIITPRLSREVFHRAGLDEAAALALLHPDDVANVDAALLAREVNATIRIVMRVFNPVLGEGVTTMLGDCGVLSGSEIAAPAFVAAALGEQAPTYVRLPDQLLMVAKRSEVDGTSDIVGGLAITGGDEVDPVTLPADESAADLVLVRTYGRPPPRSRRSRRYPLRAVRLLSGRSLRRNLRWILLTTVAVLAVAAATLAVVRDVNPWQAVYLTMLTALGGTSADLAAPGLAQVTEVLLVIVGIALVPLLTAAVVEAVIKARLALAAGGVTEPMADHVIVVGLGNVGTRVLRELYDFGVDVIGVDRSPAARGVQVARELGVPVVIGNANSAETLRAAYVETCRTLVVLSTDEVANLETALLGRAIHGGSASADPARASAEPAGKLRVVLRLFDEDFAGRVQRAFDITISRSVSYLAAPAFAAAMVGREVIDTISVGRRVLLVAELPVGAGSELENRSCHDVSRPHEVRLIAVRTGRGQQTLWSLPERRRLVRTDRLIVVATRSGLAALLRRTAPAADPAPLVEPEPLRLLVRPPRTADPDPTGQAV